MAHRIGNGWNMQRGLLKSASAKGDAKNIMEHLQIALKYGVRVGSCW
jgi:hypothetical protein